MRSHKYSPPLPQAVGLFLLIRGGPGTISVLVHVGFLMNVEALGIHCSNISPLIFIFPPMFYIPSLKASFPVSAVCRWSVCILSSEYFYPLPSVFPSLLYINSFEYFFPFSVIILSVLCIHSFFEYVFPLPFIIPPVLFVHSSITRGCDDGPISPLYEVTQSPQAPRIKKYIVPIFPARKMGGVNSLQYFGLHNYQGTGSIAFCRYDVIRSYTTSESKVIRNNAISDYVIVKLLLLLLLLFTAIEYSLGGSSPYNSNK